MASRYCLPVDVPVIDVVGPGHDERMLRPLGHLVADEDLAEERFLGRLGLGDQVGHGGGGGHRDSSLRFSLRGSNRPGPSPRRVTRHAPGRRSHPFRDGVLPAGAGAVRDGGHLAQRPEAVAVVHERLGAERQGRSPRWPGSSPETRRPAGRPGRGGSASRMSIQSQVDRRLRVGRELVEQRRGTRARRPRVGPRQPAPRPFEPAFLRILVEDLAAVDLADEDAGRPADRVGVGGEPLVQSAQPRDQLGPGGDHAGLVHRAA